MATQKMVNHKQRRTRQICGLVLMCTMVCLMAVTGLIMLLEPYMVSASDNEKPLHEITVSNAADLETQWNDAVVNGETNTKITLSGNISATATDNGYVFGTGGGYTTSGSLLVPTGYSLEIELNGYSLNKGGMLQENGSVIVNNGTLTISDHGTNPQTHYFEIKGETYSVTGGAIIGGQTMAYGGGIYNAGTLYFNSGIIASCGADIAGGGIATAVNAVTHINGGTFAYCYSNSTEGEIGGGGAVAVLAGATLNLADGAFHHNHADTYGGAILAQATSTVNVEKLTLYANDAKYGGGMATAGNVTVAEAIIADNDAELGGGGIYVFGGQLTVNQGAFENNLAQQSTMSGEGEGGGAIAVKAGQLNLNGTRQNHTSNLTFTGNTAVYGGAISNAGGTIEATGIVVVENTVTHTSAVACGGGVAGLDGTSTYHDCYFSNNNADTKVNYGTGRSFYTTGEGTINVDGGLVEKHSSANGISVARGEGGTINFMGDVILQYNYCLYDANNKPPIINFNGATVQYCGYANETEYTNQSGSAPAFIIGYNYDRYFIMNYYKINAHHNRANVGFARNVGHNTQVGTPEGSNDDVIFRDNKCGIFVGDYCAFAGNIYCGTFENNTSTAYAAIISNRAYSSGTVNVYGGIFRGNKGNNSGVFELRKTNSDDNYCPVLNIYGGTYENNTGNVTGVVYSSERLNIAGGTFTNNHGQTTVGSYYINRGASYERSLTITGGTFTGNTNTHYATIYTDDSRIKTTITGGTITGNHTDATSNHMTGGIYSPAEINFGGNPVIKNNTVGSGNTVANLYSSKPLNMIQVFADTANVGISMQGQITRNFTVYHPASTTPPMKYFHSDLGSSYNINRIDGEAVVVNDSGVVYALVPTVLSAPNYNGKAQNIIAGYVSEKMEVVSITHTWFNETDQATLSDNTENITNLSAYINAPTGNIIATNAGRYQVTFHIKSGNQWLNQDGSTSTDDITITAYIYKYLDLGINVDYILYDYTGSVLEKLLNPKPEISTAQSLYLQDWTVTRATGVNLHGRTFGLDANYGNKNNVDYTSYISPVYQSGMGRNYYVNSRTINGRIKVANVNNNDFFEVVVDEANYTGYALTPGFNVSYRGTLLGRWTGTAWEENSEQPYGPFSIKNVIYKNNLLPSSETNNPNLSFEVDTDYESNGKAFSNFAGTYATSFIINARSIGNEGDETANIKIVGEPKITLSKVYDGTRTVAVEWKGLVTLEGGAGRLELKNIVATYDNANAGTGKTITVRYVFSGTDAYLYGKTDKVIGEITPKPITSVTGLTAKKVYDGTNTATMIIDGATYHGKLDGDEIVLVYGGDLTYRSPNVGTGKELLYNMEQFTLSGYSASNYCLADDWTVGLTGTITPATLTAEATSYQGEYDAKPHQAITPGKVTYSDGATDEDKASEKWEFSLDQIVWETEIPYITKAMNIPVYFRVSAKNHTTYEDQVRFALSPLPLSDASISLGQTTVTYDGQEHNLNPRVIMQVGDETIVLQNNIDYKLTYQNDYTEGEYENGIGDTKNVGTVTITITGLGSSCTGTAAVQPQFSIVPQTVNLPVADQTNFYYNGEDQTYNLTEDGRYSITGNVQSAIGEHQVTVALVNKHNYIWANGSADDLHYFFTIYKQNVVVDWHFAHDVYYVGKTYTAEDALAGTIGRAQNTLVEGSVEFMTADGNVIIADADNTHFNTKNPNFNYTVNARFVPTDPNFAPVSATLTLPAKWIVITFHTNSGENSGVLQTVYNYNDAIIYIDKSNNETILTRPYYTHVGWKGEVLEPISFRGLTQTEIENQLKTLGVNALSGEIGATADATYYAVWSYVDYKINFYKNNPKQYTTLSEDYPISIPVSWTDNSADLFMQNYNGSIEETANAYVYTFNYDDWINKKQNIMSFNDITWNPATGFEFAGWVDGEGNAKQSLNTLKNYDLYAKWQGLSYNINFMNSLNGEILNTLKIRNGEVLTSDAVSTPVQPGYNFSGWYLTATAASTDNNDGAQRIVLDSTRIWTTADMTLYAGWTHKNVVAEIVATPGLNLQIMVNDSGEGSDKVLHNGDYLTVGSVIKFTITERTGYAFDDVTIEVAGETAHFTNKSFEYTVKDYNVSENQRVPLVITGNYHAIDYHITYSHESSVWNFVADYDWPQKYSVENVVVLPVAENLERDGYSFIGWYLDESLEGDVIKTTTGMTSDVVLYPKWRANNQNVVLYKGKQVYATVTLTTDSTYNLVDLSNEAGFEDYTFQGWSEQADLGGTILPAGSDYLVKPANNNLYAVWALKTGNLTVTADKTGDWYNFSNPVITLTANYDYAYTNLRNGIKTVYRFYRAETQTAVGSETNSLSLSEVSDTGSYYCEITISDQGYARPVTIQSSPLGIEIWCRDLENAVFSPISNLTYTGEALTPELPSITLDGHTLVPEVDFTYQYSNNILANSWAHLLIEGKGSFTGSVDKSVFYIEPATMDVTVTPYTGIYDGAAHSAILMQNASVDGVTWTFAEHLEGPYTETIPVYQNANSYNVYYRVVCPNYVDVEGMVTVVITAKEITVVWGNTNFTYNAQIQEPTASVDTGIENETVTLSINSPKTKNAGEYQATASTDNTNYLLRNTETLFKISPKEITTEITPNGGQRQGEEIVYATAVLNGLMGDDNPEITFTYTNRNNNEVITGLPMQAGSYIVTVTVADENYRLTGLNTAPFLIRNEDLTIENYITIQQDDWVYGYQPSELVYLALDGHDDATVTYYHLVNGERVELSFNEIKNAGTYYVHVFIPAVEIEYDGSYGRTEAEAEHEFHVLPRELAITWLQTEFEYDGQSHKPNINLTNLLPDDTCDYTIQVNGGDGISAGTYTATITNLTNSNYILPSITSKEFVIQPRKITVTIADQSSVYSEEFVPLTSEVTSGTICDRDIDNQVYTLIKTDGDTVGTYQINGKVLNPNYSITFVNQDGTQSYGMYHITPKDAVVVLQHSGNFVYMGAEQTVVAYAETADKTQVAVTVQISQDGQLAIFRNVGTYELTASEASGNYHLIGANQTIEIEPAKLLVQVNDVTTRYGEEFTLTATVTGFVGDENESLLKVGTLSTSYMVNDNIQGDGNYTITASGYSCDNYAIEYLDGVLHVEGIQLKIKIKDLTSVYGDGILDPEYTFVGETVMNPSTVFAIKKDEGLEVGSYAIRGTILNSNYSIEFVNEQETENFGCYTITPRHITVKIQDKSSVYGNSFVPLKANVAYGAIIGNDNQDGSVYTLVKEEGVNAGKYKINGISTNPNYHVTFVSEIDPQQPYGWYTINKAQFKEEIKYAMYQGIYDGKEHDAITVISPSPSSGFTWEFSADGKEYSTSMPKFKLPGVYFCYFNITSQNYKDYTKSNLQVVIRPAKLNIVIGKNTVEKGQSAALDVFEVTGLCEGDAPQDVIRLVYVDTKYNTNQAEVGDEFELTAEINEKYKDIYYINSVQKNSLIVTEPKANIGLIVGGAVAGGVALLGGATATVVVIKKRKRKLGK